MKKLLRSFAICFSMYSRIPMPRVEWTSGNMRYVFSFFPLIGVLIGGLEIGWFMLAGLLQLNPLLYGAVATILPLVITGGIHMDGYMDTCDGVFSNGDREKKLEIMKDPCIGAFGVICCGTYLLLSLGLFAQLYQNASLTAVAVVGIGYLLSRCLSGLSVVWMPAARRSGLAYLFQDNADRKASKIVLSIWLILLVVGLSCLSLWGGALSTSGLAVLSALFLSFCKRQFGGITGDLAGGLLEIAELCVLLFAVLVVR